MDKNFYKIIKKGQAYMIPFNDRWSTTFEQLNEVPCLYTIRRISFANFILTFKLFNKTNIYSDFTIPIDNMLIIERMFVKKMDENKNFYFISIIPNESKYSFLKQFGIYFSNKEDLSSFFFIVKAIQNYNCKCL